MAHFARIQPTNDPDKWVVDQVLVVEPDFIATGMLGDAARWIQTSYNTQGNQHTQGGEPLRANFAGVGYTYDSVQDVFYAPQPYPSWVLDNNTWTWAAPKPYPTDDRIYWWDENTLDWVEITG